MSSDLKDSSYDLSRAARLAASLNGSEKPTTSAGGDGYVAFSAAALRFGAPSEPPATPTLEATSDTSALVDFDGVVPSSAEMMGSSGWGRMLEWCAEALGAKAAFVVDSRGLGIASSGDLAPQQIEETGARLMAAFEQADKLTPALGSALSVSIELDSQESGWLVGIQVEAEEDEKLVVGLMLDRPLSRSARQKIAEAFTKKAHGL
jgi:hypothetical protein